MAGFLSGALEAYRKGGDYNYHIGKTIKTMRSTIVSSREALQIKSILQELIDLDKGHTDMCCSLNPFFIEFYRSDNKQLKFDNRIILSDIAELMGEFWLHYAVNNQIRMTKDSNALFNFSASDSYRIALEYFTLALCEKQALCIADNGTIWDMIALDNTDIVQLRKRQDQILCLCFSLYFQDIVDFYSKSDKHQLMEVIGVTVERVADFLSSDKLLTSIANRCYDYIIDLFSDSVTTLPLERKHEIISRVTAKLQRTSNISDSHIHKMTAIGIYRCQLLQLRQELRDTISSTPSSLDCEKWSEMASGLMNLMIEDIINLIGPPPSSISFCIIALGSLARKEACPYSDLELLILYRTQRPQQDNSKVQYDRGAFHYLFLLARLLDFAIIAAGETANSNCVIPGGFQLDNAFNPSRSPSLMIRHVTAAIDEFLGLDMIMANHYSNGRLLYGSEVIFNQFIIGLQGYDESMRSEKFDDYWLDLLQVIRKEYKDDSDNYKTDHFHYDVKSLIRTISTALGHLCFRYGIHAASNIERVNALHANGYLHPALKPLLIDLIILLTHLRTRMHLFYQNENDLFYISINKKKSETNLRVFVLSNWDRQWVHRFRSIILPMWLQFMFDMVTSKYNDSKQTPFNNISNECISIIAEYWVLRAYDEHQTHIDKIASNTDANIVIGDEHLCRANAYMEYAVMTSWKDCQFALQRNIFNKYIKIDSKTKECVFFATWHATYYGTPLDDYGRHIVRQLGDEIYVKEYPEWAGIDYATCSLAHLTTGYTCSLSTLYKFRDNKPVLISNSVWGANLQDVLRNDPNFLENGLDGESFSWHVIRALLISPEDDKPDNFIVHKIATIDGTVKSKLVCIDNDHSFVPSIQRSMLFSSTLLVKSIIYCSTKMFDVIHPQVVEEILGWDVDKLLELWLANLVEYQSYLNMFPESAWLQTTPKLPTSANNKRVVVQEQGKCIIPIIMDANLAISLSSKMKTLQSYLAIQTNVIHLALLELLDPVLSKQYYGKALITNPSETTMERFTKITSDLYAVHASNLSTKTPTNVILESAIGKVPTLEDIKKNIVATPTVVRNKYKDDTETLQGIRQEIMLDGNFKRFYALSNDMLRQECINGISFSSVGRLILQGIDITALTDVHQTNYINLLLYQANTFHRISLRNCINLTNIQLKSIIQKSPNIIYLDIRGCLKLTAEILPELWRHIQKSHLLNDFETYRNDLYSIVATYCIIAYDSDKWCRDEILSDDELLNALSNSNMKSLLWDCIVIYITRLILEHKIKLPSLISKLLEVCSNRMTVSMKVNDDKIITKLNNHILLMFIAIMMNQIVINDNIFKYYTSLIIKHVDDITTSEDNALKESIQVALLLLYGYRDVLGDTLHNAIQSCIDVYCDKVCVFTPPMIDACCLLSLQDPDHLSLKCLKWLQKDSIASKQLFLAVGLKVALSIPNISTAWLNAVLECYIITSFNVQTILMNIQEALCETSDVMITQLYQRLLVIAEDNTTLGNIQSGIMLVFSVLLLKCNTLAMEMVTKMCISLVRSICLIDISTPNTVTAVSLLLPIFIKWGTRFSSIDLNTIKSMLTERLNRLSCDESRSDIELKGIENLDDLDYDYWNADIPDPSIGCLIELREIRSILSCMYEDLFHIPIAPKVSFIANFVTEFTVSRQSFKPNKLQSWILKEYPIKSTEIEKELASKQLEIQEIDKPSSSSFTLVRDASVLSPLGIFMANNDTIREAVKLWINERTKAKKKYGHICSWNTSRVTDMKELFKNADGFNDAIGCWDVSGVTTMKHMFYNAKAFNKPLKNWNVSNVNDMSAMFYFAETFNQNINEWNVCKVTNMASMFCGALSFCEPVKDWNVSNVENMDYMFFQAGEEQHWENWDTSKVRDTTGKISINSIVNTTINCLGPLVHDESERTYWNCPICNTEIWVGNSFIEQMFVGSICHQCRNT